jgi:hypothetical protein
MRRLRGRESQLTTIPVWKVDKGSGGAARRMRTPPTSMSVRLACMTRLPSVPGCG